MANQYQRVLWAVDVQRDFVLPGGALYVPGAEKLLPDIKKLVDLSRKGDAFLISSADQHAPNDPEFKIFPPHCVRGTLGGELVPEAATDKIFRVPNEEPFSVPKDLFGYEQVLLEKQALDVFSNPNTEKIVEELPHETEFYVFGVVTEYCVQCAVKGLLDRKREVAIVSDVIETLKREEGEKVVAELAARGARLVSSNQAIAEIEDQSESPQRVYQKEH